MSEPSAGIEHRLSASVTRSVGVLGTAALRSTGGSGGNITFSAGQVGTYNASGDQFCGVAVTMTATRMNINDKSSMYTPFVERPLVPCLSTTPSVAPLLPAPSASFPAAGLRAAVDGAETIDAVISQWSTSLYPTDRLLVNGSDGTSMVTSSPAYGGFASYLTRITLQRASGVVVKVSDMQPPIIITLPLSDPSRVNAAASARSVVAPNNTLIEQSTPLTFNVSCPSQAALSSGAVTVNSTVIARITGGGSRSDWSSVLNLTILEVYTRLSEVTIVSIAAPDAPPPYRRSLQAERVHVIPSGSFGWFTAIYGLILSSFDDFMTLQPSWLTRCVADTLARLARSHSAAKGDLSVEQVGSPAWYFRWRDVNSPDAGEIRSQETLWAGALRAWVFLTTPHEQYVQFPAPAAPVADKVIGTRVLQGSQSSVSTYFVNISVPCGGALGNSIMQCQGGAGMVSYTCPTVFLQVMGWLCVCTFLSLLNALFTCSHHASSGAPVRELGLALDALWTRCLTTACDAPART